VLQAYFDRWQIEVNHREIKDTLGIGQSQFRHSLSVPRQPARLVATYSALLLAAGVAGGSRHLQVSGPLDRIGLCLKRDGESDLAGLYRSSAELA
jgi:hypothetical protein